MLWHFVTPPPSAQETPEPLGPAEPAEPAVDVPEPTVADPPKTPQELLHDAIIAGDRYAIVSALALMGVNINDELLSKILLPPGT